MKWPVMLNHMVLLKHYLEYLTLDCPGQKNTFKRKETETIAIFLAFLLVNQSSFHPAIKAQLLLLVLLLEEGARRPSSSQSSDVISPVLPRFAPPVGFVQKVSPRKYPGDILVKCKNCLNWFVLRCRSFYPYRKKLKYDIYCVIVQ